MNDESVDEKIARHAINRALSEKVAPWFKEGIYRCLENLERDPRLLIDITEDGLNSAGYLSFLDPASPEIETSFALAAQGASARARLALSHAGEVEAAFGGGAPLRLRMPPPYARMDVGHWQNGFYAAAISRGVEALDALCQVPIDMLRQGEGQADDYLFLFAETLQHFWHEQDDTAEVLLKALEATEEGRYSIASDDYVLNIVVPEIELLLRRLDGDGPGFNAALKTALTGHRAWYGRRDRRRDPLGFLALGPLALCCFAADAGLAVTVQSDYLLPRIIQNQQAEEEKGK